MFKTWMIAMAPMFITSGEIVENQKSAHANYVVIEDQAKTPLLNPSLQKRSIAKIRLENGIEAYIVSDPEAKHSAMSVSVKAGSWDDPKEYAGMAHFVEHVLFMGTKTYPSENDYTKHITESAGIYNAYTSTDRTVYMFAVNHGGFEGALDRLAHFFIDPLLCTSSIERELHAVDQEHAKNLENDNWRQWMILKEISNPDHPHTKFSTGNAETLRGIPQSALRNWFNQHYTPENIRVVVVSPLAKETLVDLVASRFSLVQREPSSRIPIDPDLPVLSKEQQGALLSIQPVRDVKELALLWELPSSFRSLDAEGTLHFLAYLLNSPHEGGLIDTLKSDGLIQEGKTSFDRFSDNTILFSINYTLTEEGVRKRDQIFEKTFQTLGKISQGAPCERFQEMKRLNLVHYQYQTRQNAFETVMQLGHKMFDENLSTFPEKTMLPQDFSPQLFEELLLSLQPTNACFLLTADEKFSQIKPNRKERWMNAEYALIPYSETTLTTWENSSSNTISLAPANPFVPDHLELLQQNQVSSGPRLVMQTPQANVYYLKDSFYQVPEIAVSYRIHTPIIDGSARSAALAELFCNAFNDRLHSTMHMAKVAGLNAALNAGHHYIQLNINGYSEKTPKLADILFAKLKSLYLPQERFAILKEQLKSTYANASKELPCMQGKELLESLLITATPMQSQKLEELKTIDYEDFLWFSEEAFKTIYLEGFVYGNCTEQAAINLSSRLISSLDAEILPQDLIEKRKVRLLPLEDGPYVVTESTPCLGEAALLAIQQGPYSYDRRARQMILGKYLQEFFFDRLRTKQQTGYFVRARDSDLEGQLLQLFIVQSSSHHTQELLARFDLFLDEINQEFEHLVSLESFNKTRSMVLQELKLPPENLQGMAARFTTLAFEYNASFDYYPKLIASVENLKYEDVKNFVHETLSRKNTRRLAVLVEGKMPGKRPFIYRKIAKEEIGVIGELEPRQYR
jgi:insulysin